MDRRTFLTTAIASGTMAATSRAFAATALDGHAIRASNGSIRLDWTAKDEPVSIFVSSDPDAPRPLMRPLKAAIRGGKAELPVAVAPRPYFLLSAPDGRQTYVAERLLPLQGGRNFRDLGGYRTADNRQVRWGRIFRSGVMKDLTLSDMTYLSNLGIEVICDLRSIQERQKEPNPFVKSEAPQVVATDYEMPSLATFQHATNRAEAINAFAAAYIEFTQFLTPQYTDMFARLVHRQTPLAFNCSAGKDRTGVGAALILSVLGVPRETVVADYALTQVYTPPSFYMKQMKSAQAMAGMSQEQVQAFANMPRDVLEVVMGSDPECMRQTLAEMDRQFGGPIELAKTRFGLTDAKIAFLRGTYLA